MQRIGLWKVNARLVFRLLRLGYLHHFGRTPFSFTFTFTRHFFSILIRRLGNILEAAPLLKTLFVARVGMSGSTEMLKAQTIFCKRFGTVRAFICQYSLSWASRLYE